MQILSLAEDEFNRLCGAHAWSPVRPFLTKRKNQYGAYYTFRDGSILTIKFDGSADFCDVAGKKAVGKKNWHWCNR